MVTWHLAIKLFPAKCHERATLRKLWRQTGNSSLLPTKCWPLLHVIAGISARFSNFAFVLFCYITNHLMTGPWGTVNVVFLELLVSENIEIRGKQNSLFPSGPVILMTGNTKSCETTQWMTPKDRWPMIPWAFVHRMYLLHFRAIHRASYKHNEGLRCDIWRGEV